MATAAPRFAPGQIWQDNCYYLNRSTGACERKYVLVLAVDASRRDVVTAVFTSKSHGLTQAPACSSGPPRSGYYVGVPGGVLSLPTWVDFSSLDTVDEADLLRQIAQGRTSLLSQALAPAVFCGVLRCVLRSEDVTGRQARLVGDVITASGCA